jgi:hypothetical protein
MKTIIQLAFIGAVLLSCKKKQNNQPAAPPQQQNNVQTFPSEFKEANVGYRAFDVNGACWNHLDWSGSHHAHVYMQGGNTYIDSLNYVVIEPLPITIVDPTHFTFNTYTLTADPTKPFVILSGSGVLTGDTMVVNVSAKTMSYSTCSNQNFTFAGKYKKLP